MPRALKRIAEKTHLVPRHRDAKGRPTFNVNFYCVDAAGRAAGAAIWSGGKYVVGDADGVRSSKRLALQEGRLTASLPDPDPNDRPRRARGAPRGDR